MAPLRRYLRITPASVLEVRIYPSPPGPWLLSTRPLLASVLAAVRPLILPKLREENERIKAKGRGRGVKDVVLGGTWGFLCWVGDGEGGDASNPECG